MGAAWLVYGYADIDGDGVPEGVDCDDDDVDEDCDGLADDQDDGATGAVAMHADGDGDGAGDPATEVWACDEGPGRTFDESDCDDTRADVHVGAPELCDGVDQDCDGVVDDDATDVSAWEADDDGDGYTDRANALNDCAAPEGYASASPLADCDDASAAVHPGAPEVADDGVDQDCDGEDTLPVEQHPGDNEPTTCGCSAGGAGAPVGAVVLGVALVRRRRR